MKMILAPVAVCLALAAADPGFSQSGHNQTMDHSAHTGGAQAPLEVGQSAFAAIAEIVTILRADGDTDWTKVDIATLREHLVDMDAVTLRAEVAASSIDGGAQFDVTSSDPQVTGAIRRMTLAHGQVMSGDEGLVMSSSEIPGGASMVVTGPDAALIRGLGFFGVMTLGIHHQAHHIALARGLNPHN